MNVSFKRLLGGAFFSSQLIWLKYRFVEGSPKVIILLYFWQSGFFLISLLILIKLLNVERMMNSPIEKLLKSKTINKLSKSINLVY